MHVDLWTLQPNPLRDFTIDPMDSEAIVRLKLSIEQDGFWGGVVCRQLPDGTVQVAAGHHRVAAALAAGITEADLFVAEAMDDAALIRVYARENATQRGVSSTALAGTVAAAMKYMAKCILTGAGLAPEFGRNFDLPTLRRRLLGEDGMGREILLAFLHDIPGIHKSSLDHQLVNLKASGDYARLIAEVQQEIAAEKAAAEAQELARQATEAAARHAITFDFHGVARHLKIPHQVDVFRALVTKKTALGQMALGEQEQFAAYLVQYCQAHGYELSGTTIRLHFHEALRQARAQFFRFARLEQEAREQEDPFYALERAALRFGEHLRGLTSAGRSINRQLREWPKERQAPIVPVTFERDLADALSILTRLAQEGNFDNVHWPHASERAPRPIRARLPEGQPRQRAV
jgi:hypothetical protein